MKAIVPIGAGHHGFPLKAQVVDWLAQHGHEPKDLGARRPERCDA